MPLPIVLQNEEQNPTSTLYKIKDLAMGVPLIMDSVPSTSGGQLKENQWGIASGNLYVQLNGNCYKVLLTLV